MPTVLRIGPYRFYFYSHDFHEPPHIHVDRDEFSAKVWLKPVCLSRNVGFSPKELRKIENMVVEHQKKLMEAWNGHFSTGR